MKIRLLSLVLAVLLVFPGAAFAEINFDDYSVEELIALKTQIHTEIINRTKDEKSVRVPMGSYTVGIDIPAGTYMLIGGSDISMITVYSENGELLTIHSMYLDDNVGRIDFLKGQRIEINGGAIVFSAYRGLGF